ncbi:unnamed protein product [Mucor circinelloides]
MSQEQQQTPQPDPISSPTSALLLPPVLVAALISGCTSDDVDRTDALSPSLDVNTEAATTSPSFLGVGKKRRARGLLKKAESKAEKKIRAPSGICCAKNDDICPPRELTSWQKFVAMQQQTEDANDNLLRGAGKFAVASRLAMGWQSLTQEERDSFKDREIASKRKQKKRKVDDDETTIKSHHYNAVIKVFKTNINAMLQNFRSTHIILIAVTEDNIRETHLYPPVVLSNSDKDIPFPIIIKQCGVSD